MPSPVYAGAGAVTPEMDAARMVEAASSPVVKAVPVKVPCELELTKETTLSVKLAALDCVVVGFSTTGTPTADWTRASTTAGRKT